MVLMVMISCFVSFNASKPIKKLNCEENKLFFSSILCGKICELILEYVIAYIPILWDLAS